MKQQLSLTIFFIFISLFFQILFAQTNDFSNPQIINEENLNKLFGKKVLVFLDKTNKMSFKEIKKQKFDSLHSHSKDKDRFIVSTDITHWYQWTIESQLKYDMNVFLVLGYLSNIEVIVEYQNDTTIVRKTGVDIPTSLRDISLSNSSVRLFLPKNKKIKIWVKANNQYFDRQIIFRFGDVEKFILRKTDSYFYQALLHGALWMLFLYNLIFYVINKDKTYLYYLIYILVSNFLILFTSFPEKFYTGELIPYFYYIYFGLLGNIAIWYMMFVRHFTQTKKYTPQIDKWSVRYLTFRIFWIISILTLFALGVFRFDTTNWTVSLTIIVDICFGIFISLKKNKKENQEDKLDKKVNVYLSTGSLCLFLGGGLSTTLPPLGISGSFYIGSWEFSFFEIGLFLQLFIFSIGLGIRAKEIEKQKQKALEKNEKLVREQNVVLEQKVTERTQQIEKQKNIIEQKNDDIISSINYAKRIQTALLPKKDKIETYLPDLLLFYQPKDIVSGDFYWFTQIENESFLVVADCTGHGVPGAFMTVIGENLLEQII
ncbi:MAG: hypothetical protein EAZ85_13120 [Bacteroidetes bacterium]|nr:MAG: hypothetical protein EAZ85_13120 [Bacteroidota bacterium]TAG86457.1 MAG: hypothetical protein EAZ20_12745 [Bacteroidota bacterium]